MEEGFRLGEITNDGHHCKILLLVNIIPKHGRKRFDVFTNNMSRIATVQWHNQISSTIISKNFHYKIIPGKLKHKYIISHKSKQHSTFKQIKPYWKYYNVYSGCLPKFIGTSKRNILNTQYKILNTQHSISMLNTRYNIDKEHPIIIFSHGQSLSFYIKGHIKIFPP